MGTSHAKLMFEEDSKHETVMNLIIPPNLINNK